jgi:CheY-like chemotaxis protein
MMPVMDGLTAIRAIRALEGDRGDASIPIIVLSANATSEDMNESRQAGGNAHLGKPLSKRDLTADAIDKCRKSPGPDAWADQPVRC